MMLILLSCFLSLSVLLDKHIYVFSFAIGRQRSMFSLSLARFFYLSRSLAALRSRTAKLVASTLQK